MEFGPSWCIGSTFPRAIPHPSVNLYYSCEAQGLRGDLEVLCYQALEDVWEVRSWRSTPHSGQRDLQWAILEICRMGRGCLLILVFVWPGLFPTWVGLLLCPRHLSLSTHTCPRCFYSLLEIYLPIYIFCVIYKKQVLFKNLKTILKYVCMRECHTAWGQMSGQCVCECAHSMGADVRGLCVCVWVCYTAQWWMSEDNPSYNSGPGTRDFTQWTILLVQQNILKWLFKKYCVHMFMMYVSKCACHRMYVEVHRRLRLLSTSVMGSRDQTEVIRRLYTRWTSSPGPQQDFMQSNYIWHVLCGELISPLKNNIIGRVFRQQTLVFWSLTTYAQHLFFPLLGQRTDFLNLFLVLVLFKRDVDMM